MKPQLHRRIQRYGWDLAASLYDDHWQRNFAPVHAALLELAAVQAGDRALDMACGPGTMLLPLVAAVGPHGAVVGTDLSANMVEGARRAAAAHGIENASFERAEAESLGLADSAFDVAVCSLGMMYVVDSVQALRELRRVVRPGGHVGVAVWGARKNCGWAEVFSIVDARVRSSVCPLFFRLGTGDVLQEEMKTAGLLDVQVRRMSTRLFFDTPESACGAVFAGGPVALAYSRWDDALKAEAHAEYLQSIAAYRADDGYHVPGEFVIASGRTP